MTILAAGLRYVYLNGTGTRARERARDDPPSEADRRWWEAESNRDTTCYSVVPDGPEPDDRVWRRWEEEAELQGEIEQSIGHC